MASEDPSVQGLRGSGLQGPESAGLEASTYKSTFALWVRTPRCSGLHSPTVRFSAKPRSSGRTILGRAEDGIQGRQEHMGQILELGGLRTEAITLVERPGLVPVAWDLNRQVLLAP